MRKGIIFLLFINVVMYSNAQQKEIIHLWPGSVPGEDSAKHPSRIYPDTRGNVVRITDINDPLVTVFVPKGKENTGAAVIVCPGGGNKYLALNMEGDEVAEWLSGLGITAFVLQYRVPMKQKGALQDIQRAIRIIRNNAEKWKLDTNKIGVMGFSAGGNLAGRATVSFNTTTYAAVDATDSLSCRPDFGLMLYPGSLSSGPEHKLKPEFAVDKNTPPIFLFVANDDGIGLPLSFGYALHDAKIPMELHVYPTGGHGYGLRKGNPAAEAWPPLAEKWMMNIFNKKEK
ncbi:MAG: alpha/beta hydrolase [Chitinophagaceae bacterium]